MIAPMVHSPMRCKPDIGEMRRAVLRRLREALTLARHRQFGSAAQVYRDATDMFADACNKGANNEHLMGRVTLTFTMLDRAYRNRRAK